MPIVAEGISAACPAASEDIQQNIQVSGLNRSTKIQLDETSLVTSILSNAVAGSRISVDCFAELYLRYEALAHG
jgi:hypothetical protein